MNSKPILQHINGNILRLKSVKSNEKKPDGVIPWSQNSKIVTQRNIDLSGSQRSPESHMRSISKMEESIEIHLKPANKHVISNADIRLVSRKRGSMLPHTHSKWEPYFYLNQKKALKIDPGTQLNRLSNSRAGIRDSKDIYPIMKVDIKPFNRPQNTIDSDVSNSFLTNSKERQSLNQNKPWHLPMEGRRFSMKNFSTTHTDGYKALPKLKKDNLRTSQGSGSYQIIN